MSLSADYVLSCRSSLQARDGAENRNPGPHLSPGRSAAGGILPSIAEKVEAKQFVFGWYTRALDFVS